MASAVLLLGSFVLFRQRNSASPDLRNSPGALAESSTVLVDTPGLYSRMNFGYDVLTRRPTIPKTRQIAILAGRLLAGIGRR